MPKAILAALISIGVGAVIFVLPDSMRPAWPLPDDLSTQLGALVVSRVMRKIDYGSGRNLLQGAA